MKKAIVIGTGAGGATAAKELQGYFDVTILEAGKEFHPLSLNLSIPEKLKKMGLLFDEKLIQKLFPTMNIRKAKDRMILVNGIGHGGTTTICTGNALRMDNGLKEIGVDLDEEFEEISQEIPVTIDHRNRWRKTTERLYDISQEMNLDPQLMPKMGHYDRCKSCGRCVLGCPQGAKWDSRHFLRMALDKGAQMISRCKVQKIVIENGRAKRVLANHKGRKQSFQADLIILAAGGFGTPIILESSGISCEPHLFVDPVLCVAAEQKGTYQNQEMPMPFFIERDHFILSPYFDHLSFFFNKDWKYPPQNILSLMIKLADNKTGSVSRGRIKKSLGEEDKERLSKAVDLCKEILHHLGIYKTDMFLGTLNAGHPGGMLPLTEHEAKTLHSPRLPENLYVSDATLLPESMGNPPILTITALAKRVSKVCIRHWQ
jgi:choline dehydrogenase-like flavoprotein